MRKGNDIKKIGNPKMKKGSCIHKFKSHYFKTEHEYVIFITIPTNFPGDFDFKRFYCNFEANNPIMGRSVGKEDRRRGSSRSVDLYMVT